VACRGLHVDVVGGVVDMRECVEGVDGPCQPEADRTTHVTLSQIDVADDVPSNSLVIVGL